MGNTKESVDWLVSTKYANREGEKERSLYVIEILDVLLFKCKILFEVDVFEDNTHEVHAGFGHAVLDWAASWVMLLIDLI